MKTSKIIKRIILITLSALLFLKLLALWLTHMTVAIPPYWLTSETAQILDLWRIPHHERLLFEYSKGTVTQILNGNEVTFPLIAPSNISPNNEFTESNSELIVTGLSASHLKINVTKINSRACFKISQMVADSGADGIHGTISIEAISKKSGAVLKTFIPDRSHDFFSFLTPDFISHESEFASACDGVDGKITMHLDLDISS